MHVLHNSQNLKMLKLMHTQPGYHFGLSLESHRAKSPIHVHIFLPVVMEVTLAAPNRLESATNMSYHLLSGNLHKNVCCHILKRARSSFEGAQWGECCSR